MTKNLEFVFENSAGKDVVLTLAEPKDGLTKAECDSASATIIAKNIFSTTGGDLITCKGVRIRTSDVTTLA